MKRACVTLFALPLLLGVLAGQTTAPARPDVYHVHFTKAALGKASQLGDYLKTPNPKAAMPGHTLVLRHQVGESWDYVAIEHLGSKASVEAAGTPVPTAARDLSDWQDDTFVNGPPWADFARAMGIDSASASKTTGSVYVVSLFRAAPGPPRPTGKAAGLTQPRGRNLGW